MNTNRCEDCGAKLESGYHERECSARGPAPGGSLVVSARSSGRYCHIVCYHDGPRSPIKAELLFRTSEDAAECARVLSEARRPIR